MELKINGETQEFSEDTLAIEKLLNLLNVESPDMVSVQLNGNFIQRKKYEQQEVQSGDELEFLYFMGGGSYGLN